MPLRSAASFLDQRNQPTENLVVAEVISVDYVAKQIQANIRGQSGLRKVLVGSDTNVGTAASPKVSAGDQILVVHPANSPYYFYLPMVVKGSGGRTILGGTLGTLLGTPKWRDGYPYQVANVIYGAWDALPDAHTYEIWQNTTAVPDGASLVRTVGNVLSYSWPEAGVSDGELIRTNSLFETGTFEGWEQDTPPASPPGADGTWEISTLVSYGGSGFSALSNPAGMPGSSSNLISRYIPVYGSTEYGVSYAAYTAALDANSGLSIDAWWYDTDKVQIGGAVSIRNSPISPAATWIYPDHTRIVSPVNARFLRVTAFAAYLLPGREPMHIGKISVLGPERLSSGMLYAIRALDINGNASPFSSWRAPTLTQGALGVRTSPHLQMDFDRARLSSSVSNISTGATFSPQGLTTTGWEVPLDDTLPQKWETWTYASSTTFTVPYDARSRYGQGTRVRCKQGGNFIYGVVRTSSYAAPNTTVTVRWLGGAALANATITDNYYSLAANPQGFDETTEHAGTTFPSNPATGEKFFRTDLGWECYYDGTRWLTCHDYQIEFNPGKNGFGGTVPGDFSARYPIRATYLAYVTRIDWKTMVSTTNNGSNYWNLTTRIIDLGLTAATNINTLNTSADVAGTWTQHTADPAFVASAPNRHYFDVTWTPQGSPGALAAFCVLQYKLIVT